MPLYEVAAHAASATAHPQRQFYAPTGLTGATAAGRFVGTTASGAPATGTFAVGDFSLDQQGKVWVCTVAGTPGTWEDAGAKELGRSVLASNQTISSTAQTPLTSVSVTVTSRGRPYHVCLECRQVKNNTSTIFNILGMICDDAHGILTSKTATLAGTSTSRIDISPPRLEVSDAAGTTKTYLAEVQIASGSPNYTVETGNGAAPVLYVVEV